MKFALPFFVFLLVFTIPKTNASPADWLVKINHIDAVTLSDSIYVVQQGDTYYSLSHQFNVPIDSLQKWNGKQLLIGQELSLVRPVENVTITVSKAEASAVPVSKPATTSKASVASQNAESTSAYAADVPTTIEAKTKQRILVIPFDPYLYFSDADYEIARQSKIPRQNVRHVFRGRLNALLAPKGYESIHLLGGVYRDSVSELSRIYESLNYGYQDNKESKYNHEPKQEAKETGAALKWVERQKEKLGIKDKPKEVPVAQDETKHFGVEVKDPEFFGYFNDQYGIDYYVFINQFEVKTVYEHCLDRAAQNYERNFTVHYSIYNSKGELVSGNRVNVPYESNINDVQRIVQDNMPTVAQKVLADLPASK
ncbi:LysM peptidoglycan-binding domain-containing protein [Pontibacter silvestris]|uniref:LysM peptidoglycan-binding domain-containing protein n=1 Tax=Pontibacter silvestris TaxID=2305183 RepID=A0ABW4WYZ1_9BACT|nr:LysM domain-containing protein [Pontibacter silvestris]MCC9138732.1 LysM peptidoglycan-binding domain-containing protein [Pontibacter silvestris]